MEPTSQKMSYLVSVSIVFSNVAAAGQPGYPSSISQPMHMPYMQQPQFQSQISRIPLSSSYTFNTLSFGQPTSVSSQFHVVSQMQTHVASSGEQPWMPSGNQGPLTVSLVPQTGQQHSTAIPTNQVSPNPGFCFWRMM